MLRNYYRDATAAIVVYDISQPKTFQNTIKWKADIDRKVKTPDGFPIPYILMANKGDLRETQRLDAVYQYGRVGKTEKNTVRAR